MSPDVFPPEKRSWIMSRIRSKHTKPEERLAELLDSLGVRYVRYAKVLGHTVDFYVPDRKLVIEYRSCFWHAHEGCPKFRIPKSNREYWEKKLMRNRERDKEFEETLKKNGYNLLVVWGCQNMEEVVRKCLGF